MAPVVKKVAVTTEEGLLINQHLGHATHMYVYEVGDSNAAVPDIREAPQAPHGPERWEALARILDDCEMILTEAAGPAPTEALAAQGIVIVLTEGLIDDALSAVAAGKPLPPPRKSPGCCGGASGMGCG